MTDKQRATKLLAWAADNPPIQKLVNKIAGEYRYSKHGDPEKYLTRELSSLYRQFFDSTRSRRYPRRNDQYSTMRQATRHGVTELRKYKRLIERAVDKMHVGTSMSDVCDKVRRKFKADAWKDMTPAARTYVCDTAKKRHEANRKTYAMFSKVCPMPPMPRIRKNQSADIYARTEQRRREGKQRAMEAREDIRARMRAVDRYQPTWAMKNMIRALEIHPWQNTVADWQRYYEAKYILQLRRSRARGKR